MELTYELTMDDLIHYNMYHTLHSESTKRVLRKNRILFPILFTLIGLSTAYLTKDIVIGICFIAGGLFLAIFYKKLYINLVKKSITASFASGNNDIMLGSRTMRIEKDAVYYNSELSESKYKGKFINQILSDEKYVYVYLSAITSFIVPKNLFETPEKEAEFVEMLQPFVREQMPKQ